MIKVITYGTYDLLHYGHVKLLERAKRLGDYLIVGVTADDFDKTRGKINVQQSLMERVEAVRATGLADEIIIEEYEGQKIDDIRRHNVDIFTVGSDWEGHFDYLNEYCKVVYLPRTQGVSSSEIRTEKNKIKIGLIGEIHKLSKFIRECSFVNGIEIAGICSENIDSIKKTFPEIPYVTSNFDELLSICDSVYIVSPPNQHYVQIKKALSIKKHVLCESPIALKKWQYDELRQYAKDQECVLMDGIKTAYSTAYSRLLLLAKSGKIGKIVSVDATCTSLRNSFNDETDGVPSDGWNTICEWGPPAMLPIFQLLGNNYENVRIVSLPTGKNYLSDGFTKVDFTYDNSTASLKIGTAVKSEGELIISGTKGYIYVPAPWWKTDYFEIRYENPLDNQRYFYQLDGEGIRYEIVAFIKSTETKKDDIYVENNISASICDVMETFFDRKKVQYIHI